MDDWKKLSEADKRRWAFSQLADANRGMMDTERMIKEAGLLLEWIEGAPTADPFREAA